ncbi:DKNYY domain-containing protein [Sebaldella termitidis]|uniref:DKNYY domain-containing protein n=1 Tax=Sebaldella termitidis TaxID=826 RepID=UPI003EBE0432
MKKLVFIFISLVFFAYGDEFVREYGTYELVKCERKAHDRCIKVSDYTPIKITDFDRDKEKKFVSDGKNIYYQNENNYSDSTKYYSVFQTADAKTFSVINDLLAKDKNNVYYITRWKNIPLKDADPKTFEYIGESYPFVYVRDKKRVYAVEKLGDPIYIIKNADPATFMVLKENYSKDKNHVYFQEKPAKGIDVKTFEVLGYFHVKDKNNIYVREHYDYKPIRGADMKTFEILTSLYTKDKNNVYYDSKIINGADSLTFMMMKEIKENEHEYARDKKRVYYRGREIAGSDSATFEIINRNFSKDRNNVYYKSNTNTVISGICENNFSEEKISADILETQVSEELMGQFLRGYPAEEKSYYEIKEINKPLFGKLSEAVKISRCETEEKDSWKKLENANPATFEVNYEIRLIIPAGKYSSSGIPRISESYISNDGKNYYIDFYRVDEQLWRKIITKYTNISENKR